MPPVARWERGEGTRRGCWSRSTGNRAARHDCGPCVSQGRGESHRDKAGYDSSQRTTVSSSEAAWSSTEREAGGPRGDPALVVTAAVATEESEDEEARLETHTLPSLATGSDDEGRWTKTRTRPWSGERAT